MDQDLKNDWKEAKFQPLSEQQRAEIMYGRRRTALQRLADRYKWFSNMALPMMLLMPFVVLNNVLYTAPWGWKLTWSIFAASYFALCSIMDRWLYHGIKSIDCATMTVNEVSAKAMFYRKRHLQFIIILLPMAIVVIGSMSLLVDMNIYFMYGIIIGGVTGLALGLRQFLKFMSDYRTIDE